MGTYCNPLELLVPHTKRYPRTYVLLKGRVFPSLSTLPTFNMLTSIIHVGYLFQRPVRCPYEFLRSIEKEALLGPKILEFLEESNYSGSKWMDDDRNEVWWPQYPKVTRSRFGQDEG